MAWNFQFQGVLGDAIAALNNVTVEAGPGHQDQLNRATAAILQELQAMQLGTVLVQCSGKFHGALPNYRSEINIIVQNQPVLNHTLLSPPNTSTTI